ncbi:MAG: radical SAM protein, partial [Chloroflexi bacterium]|nr:radical SAM protein [Chloroflexota bacterium]
MIAFGPVPSRRLGRSLGINNIPPKICTYACVYCQLGRTLKMQVARQAFYGPEEVIGVVRDKVTSALDQDEAIDYLSFVPDGEPTLDLNLGVEISALRELGIRIAVISNASLIWREDVRAELMAADWVSLKVDAVRIPTWRQIDRPHGSLTLHAILDGIRTFAGDFKGDFVTETML